MCRGVLKLLYALLRKILQFLLAHFLNESLFVLYVLRLVN